MGVTQEVHNSAVLKLKQKYLKIRDGNKISSNQRQEWEIFELISGPCYWR